MLPREPWSESKAPAAAAGESRRNAGSNVHPAPESRSFTANSLNLQGNALVFELLKRFRHLQTGLGQRANQVRFHGLLGGISNGSELGHQQVLGAFEHFLLAE